MSYTVYSPETAPEASKEILRNAKGKFGFVPNILGIMAEAPALLKAYTTLAKIFDETSLNLTERQVVLLTASVVNGCEYCVAAHSAIARMQGLSEDVVQAAREGKVIIDPKLEALRRFTRTVVKTRGWPHEDDTKEFLAAGYTRAQVLEVLLGVGFKMLSNYANHIAATPIDVLFQDATRKNVA